MVVWIPMLLCGAAAVYMFYHTTVFIVNLLLRVVGHKPVLRAPRPYTAKEVRRIEEGIAAREARERPHRSCENCIGCTKVSSRTPCAVCGAHCGHAFCECSQKVAHAA